MDTLKAGVKLASVTIRGGEDPDWYSAPGNHSKNYPHTHASEIVVVEENGQMGSVAWAKVTLISGKILLVNLALCEEVELAQQEGGRDA